VGGYAVYVMFPVLCPNNTQEKVNALVYQKVPPSTAITHNSGNTGSSAKECNTPRLICYNFLEDNNAPYSTVAENTREKNCM
jgi:hypothetical protein